MSSLKTNNTKEEIPEILVRSKPIIVFDVNETLLDITSLDPLFMRVFGDPKILREWFAQLVLYSQTLTLSGLYTPFGDLATGSFKMVASIHNCTVNNQDIEELKSRLGKMPAHSDVVPALSRLRDSGFRMATLSNSASGATQTVLEQAGLSNFFERSFSVGEVKKFKPAAETYRLVTSNMGVETSDMLLVACHLWDTIGAQAAGCRGALITRPYNALLSADNIPTPDFVGSNLSELVDWVLSDEYKAQPHI